MILSRRDLLRTAAIPLAARAQTRKRPNILFLLSDDQRFDTVAALGNREIRTPNLDRLVRRGTSFDHAAIMGGTVGAVCIPSRAMLLTGQTLFHLHESIVAPKDGETRGRPFEMFPETFRKAGYETFGIGKWHNGPRLYARCFDQGGPIMFGGMSDHLKVPIHDFNSKGAYPSSAARTGDRFSSEMFSDAAIGFLKGRDKQKPFLMYAAYTAPHDPRMAPKAYAEMYPPSKIRLPKSSLPEHPFDNGELKVRDEQLAPWPRTPGVVREHISAYYAMITHLDAQIGRVLAALDESGETANTIVVFAGDNGLAVGRHGLFGKQNLYDHSVRVPLVLSGPGIPRGRRNSSLCYLLDVFPTLCELTGVATPPTVEGRSIAAAFGRPRARLRDSLFFAYRSFQRAVRTDEWKLIRYNAGGRENTQLFNIESDPWEITNLVGETRHAARLKEMKALLKDWMKKVDDPLDLDKPNWGQPSRG